MQSAISKRDVRTETVVNEQSGAAPLIEASFIYPLIILAVLVLIYTGIYVLELSLMQDKARSAAVYTARTMSFPGYSDAAGQDDKDSVFGWCNTQVSASQVNAAYKKIRPYRYITESSGICNDSSGVTGYVQSLFFKSDQVRCTTDCSKRYISGRKITVTIEKDVSMPRIFKYIGFGPRKSMKVSASDIVSDNAEFIRNTDLTADCLGSLSERYGLTDRLKSMREKLSLTLGWLGVEKNE